MSHTWLTLFLYSSSLASLSNHTSSVKSLGDAEELFKWKSNVEIGGEVDGQRGQQNETERDKTRATEAEKVSEDRDEEWESETERERGGQENNAVANVPLNVVDREYWCGKTLGWPFCSGRDRTGWCSPFPGFGNDPRENRSPSTLMLIWENRVSFLPSWRIASGGQGDPVCKSHHGKSGCLLCFTQHCYPVDVPAHWSVSHTHTHTHTHSRWPFTVLFLRAAGVVHRAHETHFTCHVWYHLSHMHLLTMWQFCISATD